MSAFLCSDRHLSAIVRAWTESRYSIGVTLSPGVVLERTNAEDWQRFMDALHDANVRSVNYRYGDSDEPMIAPRYSDRTAPRVTGIALVKLLDCYDYQACEVPNYEASPVAKAIEELRSQTVRSLPGYDAAEWAI